jgi:hypothetical protein
VGRNGDIVLTAEDAPRGRVLGEEAYPGVGHGLFKVDVLLPGGPPGVRSEDGGPIG